MRRPDWLDAVCRAAAIALAGLGATTARAELDPAQVILSPEVEQGELAIENKAGIAWNGAGRTHWRGKLGVEYGITAWWASEVTLGVGRDREASTGLQSFEWENRFALLRSEAHPDDVLGLLVELERHRDDEDGHELRFGPLLQFGRGPVQVNLNLLFERRVPRDGVRPPIEFGYQWQWRWRRAAALDWGLQGFGALGPWNDWAPRAEQSHFLGPALFGRVGRGDGGAPGDEAPAFEAGLLFGLGGEAPPVTLRLQASLPF